MLRIYIGFQVIKFHCFPSSSSSSSSSSSFLLFFLLLLISIVFPPPHFYCFPLLLLLLLLLLNNRGFLQLLADCFVHQRQFLLKTATPQQLHALLIPIRQENKRILLAYRDALLNLARPNIMVKLF